MTTPELDPMFWWKQNNLGLTDKPQTFVAADLAGSGETLTFVAYRVKFEPIRFNDPTYKDGIKLDVAYSKKWYRLPWYVLLVQRVVRAISEG